jgi:DNA-binding XRE family transcriptional regulator
MSQKMRERRIELKVTQRQLSIDVGCTQQHIQSMELRGCKPSVTIALKIANRLQSTVEQLWGEK